MLVVLADDFSGAAEIGGIGHRYGLNTEIQLTLDTISTADLVVLDTDTRSLNVTEAYNKISEIGAALKRWKQPFRLFKKIDSVIRGHIIPEINALHEHFGFPHVLLMSANPSRGRKIVDGKYIINNAPLHQTVFANDPDFPVVSAEVVERVKAHTSRLDHVHLKPGELFPPSAIITGDAESKTDLDRYVNHVDENGLCCGAADLFEVFLENFGYASRPKDVRNKESDRPYTLIINGSTVRNSRDKELYDKLKVVLLPLPGRMNGTAFHLPAGEFFQWRKKVLEELHKTRRVAITIDHPIQHNKLLSEMFLNYFVESFRYVTENIAIDNIHVFLTGGATASAMISM